MNQIFMDSHILKVERVLVFFSAIMAQTQLQKMYFMFGKDISCLLRNIWQFHKWQSLEAKCLLQLGPRHDELLLNKLCFFICVLLTVLQLEWMCIILGIVLHFLIPWFQTFKKLRMFSHNQIKHWNANIAMLSFLHSFGDGSTKEFCDTQSPYWLISESLREKIPCMDALCVFYCNQIYIFKLYKILL